MLYSLEHIAEAEDFVLFDSSAKPRYGRENDSNITVAWYNLTSYRQLDADFIRRSLNTFQDYYSFICHRNMFTIPEVNREWLNLSNFLDNKEKAFNVHKSHVFTSKKFRNSRKSYSRELSAEPASVQEELFQEFAALTRQISSTIKGGYYCPKYPEVYKAFVDIVCDVEDSCRCKKRRNLNLSEFYNPATLKTKVDLQTDEKLVAAAFYRSIAEKKPVALVTKDKDFASLFYGCRQIFSQDIAFSGIMLERFLKNPVNLYSYACGAFFFSKKGMPLILGVPKKFRFCKNAEENENAKSRIAKKIENLHGLLLSKAD